MKISFLQRLLDLTNPRACAICGQRLAVEETLLQDFGDETQFTATSISDEKKGESVVLLVKSTLDLSEIKARIKASSLAPIMQPSEVLLVEEIPLLGSGKVDFKGAKQLAQKLLTQAV